MPIIVNLDVMMAKRKISLNELSERVDLTLSNLSILKTGKAKAIRFSTLEAICKRVTIKPFLTQGILNFKQAAEEPLHEKMWRILNIEQFRDQRARDIIINDVYKGTVDFLVVALSFLINKGELQQLTVWFLTIVFPEYFFYNVT